MTRNEAIAFSISTGKPITHTYFSDDEYVRYVDNRLDDLENEGVINDNQANGLNAWLTNLLVEIRRLKD